MQYLLNDEGIIACPILILGNKIDRPTAVSEDELKLVFGLDAIVTGKVGISISFLHVRSKNDDDDEILKL